MSNHNTCICPFYFLTNEIHLKIWLQVKQNSIVERLIYIRRHHTIRGYKVN